MANAVTDPLAVPAGVLGRIMLEWMRKHDAEHEPVRRHKGEPGTKRGAISWAEDPLETINYYFPSPVVETTALQYLSERVGVEPTRIQRLSKRKKGFVSLDVADRVLSAMGYNINHFPELGPVPNPLWSQARWLKWKSEQGGCENDGGIYEPPDDGVEVLPGIGGEGEDSG